METVARNHTIEISRAVADQPEPLADLARQCYADMAVTVEDAASVWRIRLASLAPMAAAYDRDLGAVLAEMGIGLDEIANWRRLHRADSIIWLESLTSAWALVAWSHWLSAGRTGRPLIVQIGGRGSLKVPALVCGPEPGAFVGLMDDAPLRLDQPDTVASAVERGLVGASSFITPFLRACPTDIVHIVSDPLAAGPEPACFTVAAAPWTPDPTVDCLELRPDESGTSSYRQVTDPTEVAAFYTPDQPVFVHVDLSFFDLLPERRRSRACHSLASAAELVGHLAPLAGAIACVTIAYAPGLCPASRWDELAAELRTALRPLVGP